MLLNIAYMNSDMLSLLIITSLYKKEALVFLSGETMLLIPLHLFEKKSNLRLHLCI